MTDQATNRIAKRDWFVEVFRMTRNATEQFIAAEAAIRSLIAEIDVYLLSLTGPGVDRVRAGIHQYRDAVFRPVRPHSTNVLDRHLASALSGVANTHPALAAAISRASEHLDWGPSPYDLTEIGDSFAAGHTSASILGVDGPLETVDFDIGLFLIAPHILYRDHAHPAPELYAPLTGPNGWRFLPDRQLHVKPAHEVVWNEPSQPHMIKVGAVPFLCVYAWTQDINAPAHVIQAGDWEAFERVPLGNHPL